MTQESFLIPFKCGRDAEEWLAQLELVGPKYGFVRFDQAGTRIELPPPDKKADFGRRLQDLLSTSAPLPPPQSAEVVTRKRPEHLTDQQITDFGFACPTCKNTQLLLCPECKKYSCGGGAKDAAGRFQCQWCGTTLVFRQLTEHEAQRPKPVVNIEADAPRAELRYRELPPGDENV